MVTIRKANQFDTQKIYDLRSRAIVEKCSEYYSEEQVSLWTQGEASEEFNQDVIATFYVSEIDDQVIGSGKLNTETGMVDAIFVEPEYFGIGAAKQMLFFLETLAKSHGLKRLKLDATLNAAPFYRACGYVGESRSTYHSQRGISLDCIPMEKALEI